MNISITIDDNGNPIFSQEGTVDMDSIIKEVMGDQSQMKDVFTDKFEKLAESIKIDEEQLTEALTSSFGAMFSFGEDMKEKFQKSVHAKFNKKMSSLIDSIKIDDKKISESLTSLFSLEGSDGLGDKVSDLFSKVAPEKKAAVINTKAKEKDESAFDAGPSEVKVVELSPEVKKYLTTLGIDEEPEVKKEAPKGGLLKMLAGVLGIGGGTGLTASSLQAYAMGSIKDAFKLPAAVMKFATNPITLIGAGVIWGVVDAVKAGVNAEEWGTSKLSAQLGGFFAGSADGMFANMGKWALIGAGVGTAVFPFVGTIAGGLLGAIIGGVLNSIGAEAIAQKFDALGYWFEENIGSKIDSMLTELKYTWSQVTTWYDDKLKPAIDNFKTEMEPVFERLRKVFDNVSDTVSPLLDSIEEVVSETIWPAIKGIGTFFGDGLIKVLGTLPEFLIWSMEQIDETVLIIREKVQAVQDWFEAISEKINNLLEKLPFMKDSESKMLDRRLKAEEKRREELENDIKKFDDSIAKEKTRIKDLESKLEYLRDKKDQVEIDRVENEIKEAQREITLSERQRGTSRREMRMIDERVDGTIKAQDLVYSPNSLQVQLDKKDSLETIGDQQIFSKEGGTLDKAIKDLTEKVEKQIGILVEQMNSATNFNEMFKEYVDMYAMGNSELIGAVGGIGGSSALPSEQAIQNGYIRDPNYEFRMKMREVKL